MTSFINQVLLNVGVYLLIFSAGIFILNFFTKGFVLTFLKVKAARGKKILLIIYGVTGRYFKAAAIDEESIKWKGIDKKNHRKPINSKVVYSLMNVPAAEYDDTTGMFIEKGNALEGVSQALSTRLVDNLVNTALMLSAKDLTIKLLYAAIAAAVLALIAGIASGIISYQALQILKAAHP